MNDKVVAQRFQQRISELLHKLDNVHYLASQHDRATIYGCYAGTLTVLESLYGPSSPQAKALLESRHANAKTEFSEVSELETLGLSVRGILQNIWEEIQQGLIRRIAEEAAGQVIGDMVSLAKMELKAGFKDVAAVLAAAALEDAVKRKASHFGIAVEGKTLDEVLNALKAKSFFKGAQAPIVSSFVRFRNSAMHADWEKIQDADVSSLLGFLEPFLLQHFS